MHDWLGRADYLHMLYICGDPYISKETYKISREYTKDTHYLHMLDICGDVYISKETYKISRDYTKDTHFTLSLV